MPRVFLRPVWQGVHKAHRVASSIMAPRKPADVVDAAVASPTPQQEGVVPRAFARVDVEAELAPDAFTGVVKTGSAYSARLRQPLLVQTPPVVVLSALEDAPTHVHLKVSSSPRFVQFLEGVEETLLKTSLESKDAWFRRPVDDDVLRASFRSFYRAGALKVRVPRDAVLFDEMGAVQESVAPGSSVRCLLELSRVTLGRTEYGAMWSLVQAQVVPSPPPPPPPPSPPKCLIDPSLELPELDDPVEHPVDENEEVEELEQSDDENNSTTDLRVGEHDGE